MNCDLALHLLLEAEPDELSLAVETPLVGHVRGCARCSAVTARLRVQSLAMATVAAHARRAPGLAPSGVLSRVRLVPAGIALAAAITLFVTLRRVVPTPTDGAATAANPSADTSAPTSVRPSSPTASPTIVAAPTLHSIPAQPAPVGRRYTAERVEAARFEAEPVRRLANVVAGLPGESVERNAAESGVISVAPPEGVRATIMRTSDPNVTVVWLQPADTTRMPR